MTIAARDRRGRRENCDTVSTTDIEERCDPMADVEMPQLGETVTEGTITEWFKQVGDEVAEDEPLFEVSTDKVDSEVPSPASGVLVEILVAEGETVDVGTRLAVLGDGDGAAPASAAADEPEEAAAAPSPTDDATSCQPLLRRQPAPPPEPVAEPAPPTAPAPVAAAAADTGGDRVMSPVVRRLIARHDLDRRRHRGDGGRWSDHPRRRPGRDRQRGAGPGPIGPVPIGPGPVGPGPVPPGGARARGRCRPRRPGRSPCPTSGVAPVSTW